MNKKLRVLWTSREEQLVFNAARLAQNENSLLSNTRALIQAQRSALPAERQLSESSFYQGRRVAEYAAWKGLPQPIPASQDETSVSAESDPAQEPLPASAGTIIDVTSSACIKALAATIAMQLADALSAAIEPRLVAIEADLMTRLVESGAAVATAACDKTLAAKIPRVLIVTLRGQQGPELRKEFEGLLRVQWVESGTSETAIRALRGFHGNVILMARWISHSTDGIFKHHPRCKTIHGGMTELREELLSIAATFEN